MKLTLHGILCCPLYISNWYLCEQENALYDRNFDAFMCVLSAGRDLVDDIREFCVAGLPKQVGSEVVLSQSLFPVTLLDLICQLL
jgi:hypothetical protein